MIIKKYGNRRLYDTVGSRYITLEELATIVRAGHDVRVHDAKTSVDLTQATLTQIILESRGAAKLLPVPMLLQMVRLGDDALAEFFSRYVAWALEVYLQAKANAAVMTGGGGLGPFANALGNSLGVLNPLNVLSRIGAPWLEQASPSSKQQPSAPPASPPPTPPGQSAEFASLRRELDELRRSVGREAKKPAPAKRRVKR
ncbi:MAG: polyhydroxyalkanoate synthesis regulator DNA-binding domain-containing protein [Polyangiales bacterium]